MQSANIEDSAEAHLIGSLINDLSSNDSGDRFLGNVNSAGEFHGAPPDNFTRSPYLQAPSNDYTTAAYHHSARFNASIPPPSHGPPVAIVAPTSRQVPTTPPSTPNVGVNNFDWSHHNGNNMMGHQWTPFYHPFQGTNFGPIVASDYGRQVPLEPPPMMQPGSVFSQQSKVVGTALPKVAESVFSTEAAHADKSWQQHWDENTNNNSTRNAYSLSGNNVPPNVPASTPSGKSYRDVVSKAAKNEPAIQKSSSANYQRLDSFSSTTKPTLIDTRRPVDKVFGSSPRRQSSSDSQSSRYGLDTFDDGNNNGTRHLSVSRKSSVEVVDRENTAMRSTSVSAKGSHDSAVFPEANMRQFQKITSRKKSKPSSSTASSNPGTGNNSPQLRSTTTTTVGGSSKSKGKATTTPTTVNVGTTSTNNNGCDGFGDNGGGRTARFHVLLSPQSKGNNKHTTLEVKDSIGNEVGVLTLDSEAIRRRSNQLNSSVRLNNESGSAFRAGGRESAFINNDLTSTTNANNNNINDDSCSDNESNPNSADVGSDDGVIGVPFETHDRGLNLSASHGATAVSGSLKKSKRKREGFDLLDRCRRSKRGDRLVHAIENVFCLIVAWVRFATSCAKFVYLKLRVGVLRFRYCTVEGFKSWTHWIRSILIRRSTFADPKDGYGMEMNIDLPMTGEEALKRLLSCHGQDAYNILGLRSDCTDDDIKRYYRKQAFLVHPDKNQSYGADEAFKILGQAFEMVGNSETRLKYDRENIHRSKAMRDINQLLQNLREKMEEQRNTMHCECGKRHRRYISKRPVYEGRYCRRCSEYHAARPGDIWAESHMFNLLWYYYACMDNAVYDITEWAGCQKNNLKHMKPNTHQVQYRLITGPRNRPPTNTNTMGNDENEMDDILRLLCDSQSKTNARRGPSPDQTPPDFQYNPPAANNKSNRPKNAPRRRKPRH